jgi:hypothetical protein
VKGFRKATAAPRAKPTKADVVHERIVLDSDDNDDSKESNKRKRKVTVTDSQP